MTKKKPEPKKTQQVKKSSRGVSPPAENLAVAKVSLKNSQSLMPDRPIFHPEV